MEEKKKVAKPTAKKKNVEKNTPVVKRKVTFPQEITLINGILFAIMLMILIYLIISELVWS